METPKRALISPCGKYRYTLWRSWAPIAHNSRTMCFFMLNPSTADAEIDDQTIRKCIHYAKREGFQHLMVVNLYAFRSTDPSALWTMGANDARGPDNITHVLDALMNCEQVVVAWGNPGGNKLPVWLDGLDFPVWCLGTNKDGSPKHPCYLANDTPLVRWTPK